MSATWQITNDFDPDCWITGVSPTISHVTTINGIGLKMHIQGDLDMLYIAISLLFRYHVWFSP